MFFLSSVFPLSLDSSPVILVIIDNDVVVVCVVISTGVNRGRTRQKRHRASTAYNNEPREDKTERHRASTANKRQLADQQGRLGVDSRARNEADVVVLLIRAGPSRS